MSINVVGFKLRIFASAKPFGVFNWGPVGGPVLLTTDRYLLNFADSDAISPDTIFDDEEITIEGLYHPTGCVWLARFFLTAVVEGSSQQDQWTVIDVLRRTVHGENIRLEARVRLQPETKMFRVRVNEGRNMEVTRAWPVRVRRAPNILTFIAMGGSSSGGSGSSGPSGASSESGSSSSSSGSSGSSSGDGIIVQPSKCGVDPTLIPELMEPDNIQCNDLCAACMSFIEHLGLRVLQEEGLANVLDALRHKEHGSEENYCTRRTNPDGISHRLVLGKWENSEHELLRPAAIKTFDSILDEFEEEGGGTLLIVANSLAGAKLQATITSYWRWGNNIDIALFVAWDITHLGGAIGWVGSRPARVVNFFQTGNWLPFQNGGPIAEADVETDLTGCFSHNALPRSKFVHQSTYQEIRNAVAEIRTAARV